MSQSLPFSTVDVFTSIPFRGNQLAIIHLPHNCSFSQETRQAIAREYNFSESVFLYDAVAETSDRRLDIFTTSEELPLAGHPVIGTICYICQSAQPPLDGVRLLTKAGLIEGRYDKDLGVAEAKLPHNVRIHKAAIPRSAIFASQPGVGVSALLGPDLPLVSIVKGLSYILVLLSAEGLQTLQGNSQKIESGAADFLDQGWSPSFTGVYYFAITSRRGTAYKVQARMLEESIGEDAATGSAASTLASFLALQDGKDDQTYKFEFEQGVKMGRASYIGVRVELEAGGKEVKSVVLVGSTVLITEGQLHVPVA